MKPVVTIGLCVKNNEKTVREAVDSIVDQDFCHDLLEVIVVDGCSLDLTLAIIRDALKNTAIKTRFFSENKGLGFARQVVVDNALGKYIVWVDGDIILSRSYIKQQVDFMEQNPNAAIAAGSFGLLSDDNWVALLENVCYVIDSIRHQGKETSRLLGTEASIVRTEAIKMAGGFDSNIKGALEDSDLVSRIMVNPPGWKFYITNSIFYERQRNTWGAIWSQHFWYGYGFHFIKHKNQGQKTVSTSERSNDRIIMSSEAYRLSHRKAVFLLPLAYIFKRAAFLFGFSMAHLDGYGHRSRNFS